MAEHKEIPEPRSSAEMDALSRDEMQLLLAQRREKGARANLIHALTIMGRFKEALTLNPEGDDKRFIELLAKAEKRSNNHRCKCTSYIDKADYARKPDAEPELVEIPNYIKTFRHFSTKFNGMATFYRCQQCGCVQTLPDGEQINEATEERYNKQDQATASELKRGVRVREL